MGASEAKGRDNEAGRIRVVFATSVFGEVKTGPGLYARYLWESFQDDPEIEFHLVAPSIPSVHPRLHATGNDCGSVELYRRVQEKALSLGSGREARTVIHGNAAHSMWRLAGYAGPWVVQVNDYEVAHALRRPLRTVREYGARRLAAMLWRHRQEARVVSQATRVVCNSEFTHREVLRAYRPRQPERVITIHKSVNTQVFRRPADLPPDPYPGRPEGARIVFTGTNWRRKGLAELIGGVALAAPAVPSVHLTVVGPWAAEDLEQIRSLAAEAGVGDRVLLAGRLGREELAALHWHSDLFALPSRGEAFGVAILEALAAGRAVLATREGGIPEILEGSGAGLMVEPNAVAPESLADALCRLLTEPGLLESMGARGPARAARFEVEAMVGRVRRLYRELVS